SHSSPPLSESKDRSVPASRALARPDGVLGSWYPVCRWKSSFPAARGSVVQAPAAESIDPSRLAKPPCGSYTTAIVTAVADAPPSSVVVTLIVYIPACANTWLRSHPVVGAGYCSVVPSSQFTAQVWVSYTPGSVTGADIDTAVPARKTVHGL